MGTVPWQESVPNGPMHNGTVDLPNFQHAHAARGKNKNMIRPLARIFSGGFLYHSSRTCQLKSSHRGTKIAINFQFLLLEAGFYHILCRIARRIFLDHF
jgi:hypothetical protein